MSKSKNIMEYYWWNLELFRVFPKRLFITLKNSFVHKGGNIPHFLGGCTLPEKRGIFSGCTHLEKRGKIAGVNKRY
jgi:hypothetical protein